MTTTVIELINALSVRIAKDPTWATAEVEYASIINHSSGEIVTVESDDDPEFDDDVDESNYDPYLGMDWYE